MRDVLLARRIVRADEEQRAVSSFDLDRRLTLVAP